MTSTLEAANDAYSIKLTDVTKTFDDKLILDRINLPFAKDTFTSIVGPSGCGKSTLLRIVAGLTSVTDGQVDILGSSGKSGNKNFSFVFQDSTLLPWRTVLKNVELPLETKRVDKKTRTERAKEALKMVGLGHVFDHYPRQLSGGMKMRVSIARALVSEPEILLMDEPFAALDDLTRQKLQEELLEIWKKKKMTVLFVTHNVFEAVFLSQQIVVMKANPGQIAEIVHIEAKGERDESFRTDPQFSQYLSHVTGLIHRGIH